MSTRQDFRTVQVQEGFEDRALTKLAEHASDGYFPVTQLENAGKQNVTTIVLSQGNRQINAHNPDTANVSIKDDGIIADKSYIIVDRSDTTNYPHVVNNAINIIHMTLSTDATTNFEYEMQIGFLSEVDGSSGRFNEVFSMFSASDEAPNRAEEIEFGMSGGLMTPNRWLCSDRPVLSEFANTNTLPSTLDITTANVNPGEGDIVVRIQNTSDTESVRFNITCGYEAVQEPMV